MCRIDRVITCGFLSFWIWSVVMVKQLSITNTTQNVCQQLPLSWLYFFFKYILYFFINSFFFFTLTESKCTNMEVNISMRQGILPLNKVVSYSVAIAYRVPFFSFRNKAVDIIFNLLVYCSKWVINQTQNMDLIKKSFTFASK